jgi:hypothetical protein
MEAQEHRSIRVNDLTEVVMRWSRSGKPNSDWYHLKLPATSRTPMIVQVRLISFNG